MIILKLVKYIIELLIVSRQQGGHLETCAWKLVRSLIESTRPHNKFQLLFVKYITYFGTLADLKTWSKMIEIFRVDSHGMENSSTLMIFSTYEAHAQDDRP